MFSLWRARARLLKKRLENTVSLLRGELTITSSSLSAVVVRADGSREDKGVICRKKVTQAFVKRIASEMAGNFSNADAWKYHDTGTGTTAASNADTVLETPTGNARVAGTQVDTSTGTTGNYQSVATLNYGSSFAVTEHGLFNASASGTLFDRHVFAALNVDNGDSIQFTYTFTLNPET